MNTVRSFLILALAGLCLQSVSFGQAPETEATPPPHGADRRVSLDVAVTDVNNGKQVTGLSAQDFSLSDDKQPQKLANFEAAVRTSPTEPPVAAILVLDDYNDGLSDVSFEREGLIKFLKQNDGHLPIPMCVTIFAPSGVRSTNLSLNGNALAEYVKQSKTEVHALGSHSGVFGVLERENKSLQVLRSVAGSDVARRPGRKLLIWIGGGWPTVDNPILMEERSKKDQQSAFRAIVATSNLMRQNRVTVYTAKSIHIGNVAEDGAYKAYLKAPAVAPDALYGGLKLEVISTQTGGKVLNTLNDLTDELNECMPDAQSYYTLSFDAPPADHADEYHALSVSVDRAGLATRTLTGYYSQP